VKLTGREDIEDEWVIARNREEAIEKIRVKFGKDI
jgi:hypothetical protein